MVDRLISPQRGDADTEIIELHRHRGEAVSLLERGT